MDWGDLSVYVAGMYNLKLVLLVLNRLGYQKWDATESVALFNHPNLESEVFMDLNIPTLSKSYVERKLETMEIRKSYFDALYDAEQKDAVGASLSK